MKSTSNKNLCTQNLKPKKQNKKNDPNLNFCFSIIVVGFRRKFNILYYYV